MKKVYLLFALLLCIPLLYAQIADPWGSPVNLNNGMTIICRVTINNANATSGDIIAAFVGNELRGKTTLLSFPNGNLGVGRAFMVQSVLPDEYVQFRVWHVSTQSIYVAPDTLHLVPGSVIGSYPNDLYTIQANLVTYSISGVITFQSEPLPNIPISIQGHSLSSGIVCDVTNTAGKYCIPGIMPGDTLQIAPDNLNYDFNPPTAYFQYITANITQNFSSTTMNYYPISGTVSLNNTGLAGIAVRVNDDTLHTDNLGHYATTIAQNHSLSVIPLHAGYSFAPIQYNYPSVQAPLANLDFTASPHNYNVRGLISGASGVAVYIQGTINDTLVTDNLGSYQLQAPYHSLLHITPYKDGYTFSPATITIDSLSTDILNANFQANPIPLTISGYVFLNGVGLPNIRINYANSYLITNELGFFSISSYIGQNLSISPYDLSYLFSPDTVFINALSQDTVLTFIASPLPTYTVSGHIMNGLQPIADVSVYANMQVVSSDLNGFYNITIPAIDQLVIHPLKEGYSFSPDTTIIAPFDANQTANFTAYQQVALPTFNPQQGLYTQATTVSIHCTTPNARIYYTMNEGVPDSTSLLYTTPFLLPENTQTVVRAIAYADNYTPSAYNTAIYTITGTLPPPLISVPGGVYETAQSVAISCNIANAQLRYTLDGTIPNSTSTLYTNPLIISHSCQLMVRAYRENWITSDLVTANYVINHSLTFDLPSELFLLEEDSLRFNLLPYLTDSVGSLQTYTFTPLYNPNMTTYVVNTILTLVPNPNYFGSSYLTIHVATSSTNSRDINNATDSILVHVLNVNDVPVITSWFPLQDTLNATTNINLPFFIHAYDIDNTLQYRWLINNTVEAEEDSVLIWSFSEPGTYQVTCKVMDLQNILQHNWIVHVSHDAIEDPNQVSANQLSVYPNPFRTNIQIRMPFVRNTSPSLCIYNVKGQKIKQLSNTSTSAQYLVTSWNGKTENGIDCPSGIYLLKVKVRNQTIVRKLMLLQ